MAREEFKPPFRFIRGTMKGSDKVYYVKDGIQRSRSRPTKYTDRNSEEQQKIRAFFSEAQRAWRTLTQERKDGWEQYANLHCQSRQRRRRRVLMSGGNLFSRATVMRLRLGFAMEPNAPDLTMPPPGGVFDIEDVPGEAANCLGIRVFHEERNVEGLWIVVRVKTPETGNSYVSVRGVGRDSTAPLLESGAVYFFSPSRYPVEEGQPYGVEVKIVRTADGLRSREVYAEFVKS